MDDPYAPADPTPTTADDVVLPLASWWQRVLAQFLDSLILALVAFAAFSERILRVVSDTAEPSAADVSFLVVASMLMQTAYYTFFHGLRGATPGKIATRIVVRRVDGGPIAYSTAFVRTVAYLAINFVSQFLLFVPLVVNALRPLWHPLRQTWHDALARTTVVRAPADRIS